MQLDDEALQACACGWIHLHERDSHDDDLPLRGRAYIADLDTTIDRRHAPRLDTTRKMITYSQMFLGKVWGAAKRGATERHINQLE